MPSERLLQKQQKKQKLILENKNIALSILWLALPIFLSNFMKSFNDLIDLYFITNLTPEEYVSAATTALNLPNPVISITYSIAFGFMTAGAAIIAQYLGAKYKDSANKIAGQLLILCAGAGFVMGLSLYILAPMIMRLMGASGLAYEYMITYIRIRCVEMIPLFMFFAFQATRTSSGDTTTPFILNAIIIFSNIGLTYAFMKYLNMGIAGAAWGTVLGNVIVVPIFLVLMFKGGERHVTISIKDLKPESDEIRRLFRLAWPVAFSQALTSFGFIILNSMILSYGEATVNAFGTGNRLNSLVLLPAMGIGSITATFVGQNIGANNIDRARKSVRSAMILSILIAIVGGAIIMPLREVLISIFLEEQPEALELSIEYMFFLLAGLPLMSIFQVYMGTYQGSGETKFSLVLALIRLWAFRIPLVLIFKNVFSLPASSLWYAMTISNFGAAYIGAILYSKCNFKPKIEIRDKSEDKNKELCLT